jgi:hypothetical protein
MEGSAPREQPPVPMDLYRDLGSFRVQLLGLLRRQFADDTKAMALLPIADRLLGSR